MRGLAVFAVAVALGLLAASALGPYGYFIDELYYLSCARRPALGYVDHPPLAPWLLAVVRATLGESLLAIRLLPAAMGGAIVWVAGRIAADWGGGRFAVGLAALATAAAPFFLVITGFYSMNVMELLVWALAILVTGRIARGGSPRLWLALGALLGVGFLAKHTVVLLAGGLGLGIVLSPLRAHLSTRWPWLGVALASLLALPNLAWQIAHGWPTLEFYRQATLLKNVPTSALGVLGAQVQVLGPLASPIWGVGAVALVVSRPLAPLRCIGIAWWALLALTMAAGSSRPDRIAGLAVALVAAGAIVWEGWLRRPAARAALVGAVALGGIVLAPLALPLLPFPAAAAWASRLNATPKIERGKTSPLPQWLADRTGWESFIADMRRTVRTLTPAERRRAVVWVPDYGHAGALELWGPRYGLPPVISQHNTWWHWSRDRTDAEVMIALDADVDTLRMLYRDVREVGRVRCRWCMSWRANMPIHVARGPIRPLRPAWARLRHYE